MFFKRKHEFRPDKNRSVLSKLYLTKIQRLKLLKWLLVTVALVFLSILQDVILCRISLFGTTTDLVAYGILLMCVILDPEIGCVFALISSSVYYFSGSAPGAFVIPVIVGIAVFLVIFRQSYLQQGFFTILVCAALGMLVYEMSIFCIGLFLERTMLARAGVFATTALVSLLAVPVAYPVLMSIGKIGGDTWKE